MVKAYAGILACPVSCAKQQFRGAETAIILEDGACPQAKTCYRHQQISSSDLPNLRKLAQDFVALHFVPAVLEVIDPNQYQRPLPYTPLRTCYMYLVAGH